MIFVVGTTKHSFVKGTRKGFADRETALEYGKKRFQDTKVLYTAIFDVWGYEQIQEHVIKKGR